VTVQLVLEIRRVQAAGASFCHLLPEMGDQPFDLAGRFRLNHRGSL